MNYGNRRCLLYLFVGVAQGVITGIRGLCNGLGPALFGLIFFLFDVDLNDHPVPETAASGSISMMLAASNRTGRMSYLNTIWPSNRVCRRLVFISLTIWKENTVNAYYFWSYHLFFIYFVIFYT